MPKAYNTTDSPVVVTEDGRMIGGHERGDADPAVVGDALASGALIWVDAVPEASRPDEDRPVGDPPPKSGAGSGTDAWRAYADANKVTVADDASREQIITALDQAGVPTEAKE